MRQRILDFKLCIPNFGLRTTVFGLSLLLWTGCQKIEYTQMDSPAYLRVFNGLNRLNVMGDEDDNLFYLCMLVNPEYDGNGIPVSAEIVGDFLDQRDRYAPPFPSHIGVSTSVDNPEYPGKEPVLKGPVLNGFDLSSWAQVPSGDMHIVFLYRPKSSIPFFELDNQYKRNVLSDTTLRLEAGEVYTLHVLEQDFDTRERGVLLRHETFHKLAFSDDRVYVNFYNYSARGFYQASESRKVAPAMTVQDLMQLGIRDTMDVYLSLFRGQEYQTRRSGSGIVLTNDSLAGSAFDRVFFASVKHDGFSGSVMPYASFPLWIGDETERIHTDQWQRFYFLSPGLNIRSHAYSEYGLSDGQNNYTGGVITKTGGNFGVVNCLLQGQRIFNSALSTDREYHAGVGVPNLVVNTHSGVDNPRSFATVNTVEIINGQVYLMTVQRRYAPPVYE